MSLLMSKGHQGGDVDRLRMALAEALGDDAAAFPVLRRKGAAIDADFDAAIRRWQAGIGIIADGLVGPRGQLLLGLFVAPAAAPDATLLSVGAVSQLFPATKPANIARYLPYVEAALAFGGWRERAITVGALAVIRAESEGFVPIAELADKRNTPPGSAPFSGYEGRAELGNDQPGDGARYRGRGYVQLRGKARYRHYGERVGLDLVAQPELANAPEVAAVLLVGRLAEQASAFRAAVAARRWAEARRLVSGDSDGGGRFADVFAKAAEVWPARPPVAARHSSRRAGAGEVGAAAIAAAATSRTSKTRKDATDLRDRPYLPEAISLPDEFPPAAEVQRFLPAYTRAGLILDQGGEAACTGFGLGCVINYLRWVKAGLPAKMESVSPRMLYTLARRHDEYDGENYEGSSCRGALKGWFNNGVCVERFWPYEPEKSNPARYGFAADATRNTLGVYYRIDTASITDVQAALAQHRAVFVAAYTHAGWQAVPLAAPRPKRHADLPVIGFDGRASKSDGHAFALVGFNSIGFVVQNSWGEVWGAGGFAVITYLDWLANAMDAWVVALGVPGVVAGLLSADATAPARVAGAAEPSLWWDAGRAYRHSVVLGNDGRVSRYLTEDEQPRKLQQQCYVLPDAWFRSQSAPAKRLVVYVHGGLNSEAAAIKRASAMGRYFVGNGCYPIFLVWKTGLLESIGDIVGDTLQRAPAGLAGGIVEAITEKTDLLIEKTVGRPLARPIWSEMKENAQLAFADRHGGELLLDALQSLAGTWGEHFELHLVGHSAGAIAIGHLLSALAARRQASRDGGLSARLASIHLYAPACSVAFANRAYASDANLMRRLYLDILADAAERADNVVSVYRKSLLYLVSNALEADLRQPILGLARIGDAGDSGWDGSSDTGEALAAWRQAAQTAGLSRRTVLVSGRIRTALLAGGQPVLQAPSHGGFDNDIDVFARTLNRITGAALALPVDDLRGY